MSEESIKSFNQDVKDQPLSAWSYAIVSLVAFLFGVFLLLFFVFKADDMISQGIDAKIFYVLLIPLGLSAGAFLFGVMKSYARLNGKVTDSMFELGGPIVVAVLVVIGGLKLIPQDTLPFSLTVFVHGKKGVYDIVLKNQGQVMMDLAGHRRTESIGDKGDAYFREIPANFLNKEVLISVLADGFEPADPEKKYILKSGSIYIKINKIEPQIEPSMTPDKHQIEFSLNLAKSFLDIDKYEEAKEPYETILKSDSKNADALYGLEKIKIYELMANPQSNTGDIEKRLKNMNEQNQNDPHVHVLLGNLYAISDDTDKDHYAERHYQEAQKIDSSTASAWFGLGVLYHKQSKRNKAIEMFKKAVTLSKTNVEYINNLACLYSENGQYTEAVETYQKALNLEKNLLPVYFELTNIYRLQEDLDYAFDYQTQIIRLLDNPEVIKMPYNQAIWYHKGKNETVIKLSDIKEKRLFASYGMALTLYLMGNEPDADQYLETTKQLNIDKLARQEVQSIMNNHLMELKNQSSYKDIIEKQAVIEQFEKKLSQF